MSAPAAAERAAEASLLRGLGTSLLHRIDAWGVSLVIALLALWMHRRVEPATLLLAGAIALSYWLAYTLNDYFDAPFDAGDAAKAVENPFVRHAVPARLAALAALAVAALVVVGFAQFGLRGLAGCAVFLLVAWTYSAPPVRLKSRPGLDLVAHALFVQTFPYFICLVLLEVAWTSGDYALLGINFLASLSGQLNQQVRDFEVDSATGSTFATAAGLVPTVRLLRSVTGSLVLLAGCAFALGALPWQLAPLALAFVPASFQRLSRQEPGTRARLVAVSTAGAILYAAALALLSMPR